MEDSFPIILTSRIIRPSADTQEDTQALSVVIILGLLPVTCSPYSKDNSENMVIHTDED